MTEPLLTPIQIGSCQLKNRFVMTAACLCRCTDGFVTEDTIDFYQARARGGVGLVIAGAAGVDPTRRSQAGMMQICDDTFLPGLLQLTERIHQEDGKIFLQLLHAGAYAHPAEYGGAEPIAPSPYVSGLTRTQTQEMTHEQIQEIIGYFADAAARTVKAGFDGVELCGSVGYLIAEFLSSATNHRADEYGGSLENRMRFLLELVDAVKTAVGPDFPLMVRLSGADLIPNGNTVEDFVQIGKALEQHGVDAIDITGGWHESRIPQITAHVPHGAYSRFGKALKQQVSIPVIACNRMDLPSGRKALKNRECDLVGMCRPFLADPNLVHKFQHGRAAEIHRCLSCNQECLDRVFGGNPVGCAVNPFLGRELEKPICRDSGKKILVIGAGISGLAYASIAAISNDITILEQTGEYGGAGKLLSRLPHWEDTADYIDALYQDCLRRGVSFLWHQKATPTDLKNMLEATTYDKIIVASGAELAAPDFPIEEGAPVCSMKEFMDQQLPFGRHTVILGNDFRALEFALFCTEKIHSPSETQDFFAQWFPPFPIPESEETSPTITCLGSHRKPGGGMAKSVLWVALQEAKKQQLQTICEATIQKITSSAVIYQQDGETKTIPADLVILAQNWKSSSLATHLQHWPEELRQRVEIIGDAKAPGRITQAVRTAVNAAVDLPIR